MRMNFDTKLRIVVYDPFDLIGGQRVGFPFDLSRLHIFHAVLPDLSFRNAAADAVHHIDNLVMQSFGGWSLDGNIHIAISSHPADHLVAILLVWSTVTLLLD